jgi:ribosomal protein L29
MSISYRIKNQEIKELSDEALVHAELQLQRDIVHERMIIAEDEKNSDGMVFQKIRKAIARLRTEQRRRELENGIPKDSLRSKYRTSFTYQTKVSSSLQSLEALSKE